MAVPKKKRSYSKKQMRQKNQFLLKQNVYVCKCCNSIFHHHKHKFEKHINSI